jgi:hypothetical protein
MRKACLVALAVLLGIALWVSRSAENGDTLSDLPGSMKGYELYSWPSQGDWRFALLVGTNRLKTLDEVTSSDTAVRGVEALKRELARLPKGEPVFWSSWHVPGLTLPPDEIVDLVRGYCQGLGVELHVD